MARNGATVTFVAAGTCSITASQAGNTSYAAALDVTRSFAIDQITTTVTLTSSSTTSSIGEPVTFTARVSSQSSAPTSVAAAPTTGTVTFKWGTTRMCENVPLIGASASCKYAFRTAGSHAVAAQYSGGGSFAGATSTTLTTATSDQRVKTTKVIGRFLGQRGNAIVSNGFDASRQIDRLEEAGRAAAGGNERGGTGFAASPSTASRLGAGIDAGGISRFRFGGNRGTNRSLQELEALGMRGSVDDREAANGGPAPSLSNALRLSGSSEGANRFAFATSLSQIRRSQAAADKAKIDAARAGNPMLEFSGDTGQIDGDGVLAAGRVD